MTDDDYWRGDPSETCGWCWNGPDTIDHTCKVADLIQRLDGQHYAMRVIAELLDKHTDEQAVTAREIAQESCGDEAPPASTAPVAPHLMAAALAAYDAAYRPGGMKHGDALACAVSAAIAASRTITTTIGHRPEETTMTVRAKFKCTSITEREGWGDVKRMRDVKLHPVTSGSDENKRFYASSPSGEITIGCANAEAAAQFEIGREYYIDFTPAS